MPIKYTSQQIERSKKILAAVNGSKGGKDLWNKMSETQRQERINRLNNARKLKAIQKTLDNQG